MCIFASNIKPKEDPPTLQVGRREYWTVKQVFIINPVAGKQDASRVLLPRIRASAEELGLSPIVEITRAPGHARQLAEQYIADHEPVALYACGGDGTLNEVIQSAVGQTNVHVGCLPCGSGNDFIRNFGEKEAFLDVAGQLQAVPAAIDLLDTSLGYGVDICAAGLDAKVAYGIPKFRRLPGCGGSMAYNLSIVQAVFSRFGHRVQVTLDGNTDIRDCMMAAICNGRLYGGGYTAAPYARMDDGLLDVLLIRPVPRVKLLSFLARYKAGTHLNPDGSVIPEMRRYLQYCRAKEVRLQVLDGRPIIATVDGECKPVLDLRVRVAPRMLSILLPRSVAATNPNVIHLRSSTTAEQ